MKTLGHADGSSRLLPKYSDPLGDTVIAALKPEIKFKIYCAILCNIVRELDEIKIRQRQTSLFEKL